MSAENVELIRRIYEAVARRDIETPFEIYADEIVWDISNTQRGGMLPRQVFHGHEGVRRNWRDSLDAFGEVDFVVDELIDLGDQVLATIREQLVGRTSGAPVKATHYALWTLAGGKVTRLEVFDDREAAERAAGLRE